MDRNEQSVELGEPTDEEWLCGIKIERYDQAVRLVQPKDGQLAPDSVLIPHAYGKDFAEFIEAWSNR